MVMVSSDGWKKGSALNGTPLLNVVLLLPSGGAVFHDMQSALGQSKTAEWIKQFHLRVAQELAPDQPEQLLGFVMDNTKANRAAMDLLSEHCPRWILVGCMSHGNNLTMKDITEKVDRCPGTAQVLTPQLQHQHESCWLTSCDQFDSAHSLTLTDSPLLPLMLMQLYKRVRELANVVSDSEAVRGLLTEVQTRNGGQPKQVQAHAPHRFSTQHFVAQDLLAVEDDVRACVSHRRWKEVAKGNTKGK
jgi:hypothetical protein